MVYVGLDWADQKHDLCFLDEAGNTQFFSVPNSPEGLDELLKRIQAAEPDLTKVLIAAETEHNLIVIGLVAHGYTVYAINPKSVDRYRDRFAAAGAKDDRRDALVLASILRTDRDQHRPIRKDSELLEQLRVLCQDRQALVQTKTMLINQLTACLKSYYPRALELFCRLDQQVTLAFLEAFPTPGHLASGTERTIRKVLRESHYPGVDEKTQELLELSKHKQFFVPPGLLKGKSKLMLSLTAQMRVILRQIESYDQEIEALVKTHPDSKLFLTIKGMGANLAARVLVMFGDDRSYYPSAAAVQCEAGTAPVTMRSGKAKRVRFRRACNKFHRQTMQLFALQAINHHPWSYEYYRKHLDQGRSKSEAQRIVANTWVRILFAVWRDRITYDEQIFLQTRRARQTERPAA